MPKKSYFELLQDPRWQKKRLKIMERDEFQCSVCGDDKATLNVHHGIYEKGKKPWEYEDDTLHTLCEECHKYRQVVERSLKQILARLPMCELEQVHGYAVANLLFNDPCDQYGPLEVFDEGIFGIHDALNFRDFHDVVDAVQGNTFHPSRLKKV